MWQVGTLHTMAGFSFSIAITHKTRIISYSSVSKCQRNNWLVFLFSFKTKYCSFVCQVPASFFCRFHTKDPLCSNVSNLENSQSRKIVSVIKKFEENDTLLNFSLGKVSSGANQNKWRQKAYWYQTNKLKMFGLENRMKSCKIKVNHFC